MAFGVTRYSEIAQWSADDVELVDTMLGVSGRVSRENWIEQAHILASGGRTMFARQRDEGASAIPALRSPQAQPASQSVGSHTPAAGDVVPASRPARLADAIRGNTGRGDEGSSTAASAAAAAAASQAARADVAGLRSVRSEGLRGGTNDAVRIGVAARAPATASDLKRIRGIGVLIEKKLNALGISTYEQIANWTAGDIERISRALDFRGRIERENWVEQARILSAGGATDFSRRLDRGDAG